jgi:hypothetical protein
MVIVVRNGALGGAPQHKVFVALMKQPNDIDSILAAGSTVIASRVLVLVLTLAVRVLREVTPDLSMTALLNLSDRVAADYHQ